MTLRTVASPNRSVNQKILSHVKKTIVVSQFKKSISREHLFKETHCELLETKLHTPHLSEYHVHRPRLVEHLEQHKQLP